jgi:hypothetical protein
MAASRQNRTFRLPAYEHRGGRLIDISSLQRKVQLRARVTVGRSRRGASRRNGRVPREVPSQSSLWLFEIQLTPPFLHAARKNTTLRATCASISASSTLRFTSNNARSSMGTAGELRVNRRHPFGAHVRIGRQRVVRAAEALPGLAADDGPSTLDSAHISPVRR